MRNRAPHAWLLSAVLLVSAAGGAASCSKKDHAADQGSKASGLPPSAGGPPPAAPAAPPPAGGAATAPAGADQVITGTITLSPARKGDVSPSDVIFLVARRVPDSPGTRGSLVAVKRFTAQSFPIQFTMGKADMMFQNGNFEGELDLAARVDKDRDPITRKKGDVYGTVDHVMVGSKGIEVKLTELQKEDESLAGGQPPGAGPPSGHPGMPAGHP